MDNIMTDEELEQALDDLMYADNDVKRSLAQLMNENQIITWEEAELILADTGDEPVKCSLPQQVRPTEPENDTNVDQSIQLLAQNDPKLNSVNLNNLKRTPIPQIKRIIMAMKDNEYIEKLSLANMGLYDKDVEPLIEVLENNESLRVLNLETNYLSGEFFARLFQAALTNQTLEEIKAVNQGVSFSTESERAMIKAIFQNRGLLKISVNFRLPEGRHKVEQTTMRNQEIRRIIRRQAAEEARLEEERKRLEAMPKPEPKPQPKKPPPVIITAPSTLKLSGAPLKSETHSQPAEPIAEPPRIKSDAELPKWRRPKVPEEPKIETPEINNKLPSKSEAQTKPAESIAEPPRIKSEAEVPKWKRPKVPETPEVNKKPDNPPDTTKIKSEAEIPKWRRPKVPEEPKSETPEVNKKSEAEIPKWRRPKVPEEPKPETSEFNKKLSPRTDNKPSTSIPQISDRLKDRKSIFEKSSSSEAVDGVEKPVFKKKTPLAIPPIILADPVPPSNNLNDIPKIPKELNAKPDMSKFEKPKRLIISAPDSSITGLTIPKENLLTTSTATSATSESDAVSSTSSKPKKKKIIRRKKKKPVPTPESKVDESPIKSRNFDDHLEVLVDYPEPENNNKIESKNNEATTPKSEDAEKPKKKVVRRKKTSEGEPKLNGTDSKKIEDAADKPMGVFPRSRLISANKQ